MSTSQAIRERIAAQPAGEPFTPALFAGLGSRASIDQTLMRLTREGFIERLGRGLYTVPKISRFGLKSMPSPETVAQTVAAAEGASIDVRGAEAARRFGFSTQVPAQPVFYTTGSSRTVRVGKLQVRLQHVAARKLALAGQMQDTLEALRIQAAKPGPHQEGMALLARNLESALEAYTDTLKYMLAQQSQARAALLGSVPYLMLAGLVIAGWQMARAALICHARLQRGDATDFHGAKLAGCVLYAGLIMPRARALQASIHEGVGIAAYMKKL